MTDRGRGAVPASQPTGGTASAPEERTTVGVIEVKRGHRGGTRTAPPAGRLGLIAAYASQMARQSRLYLDVTGGPSPEAQPPGHLKDLGLLSLTGTIQEIDRLLSKHRNPDAGLYLDTTIALRWLSEVFYGLLERWGWSGGWEWRQDPGSEVPHLALPISWEDRTVHVGELAALERIAAVLTGDPRAAEPNAFTTNYDYIITQLKPAYGKDRPPPVLLFGRDERPLVRGRPKPPLSPGQYDVVHALVEVGPAGLSKRRLGEVSGHPTSAVKILRSVAALDPDWASVIVFPEKIGRGGYRLAEV
jgi:hypothetical protein